MFGSAIGLAAFLLFTVEPLVGRLATPVFGGAAGVWATVLAFFQGALLLGYLYAHLVATRLPVRTGAALHVAVAAVGVAATVAATVPYGDLRREDVPTLIDLIRVLAITIGPAAFVITATTPLLSSWYARVRRADDPNASESDPYWLYALSNGGSLVALLAYPLLIEPRIGLSAQRSLWLVGIVVLLGVLVAAAARVSLLPAAARVVASHAESVRTAVRPITVSTRLTWLALAAIPSGLLTAVTNLITTDLISAPLLWVVPLAIYLGTFIVAFSARGRRTLPIVERLAPAALTLLWVPLGSSAGWPIVPLLLIEYAGLAVVATTLHGRLARLRPEPARLTDFYLTQSLGGVLGGVFVAVVAPLAFDGIWEYPILVVAALAALAATRTRPAPPPPTARRPRRRPLAGFVTGAPSRLGPYAGVALVLIAMMAAGDALALEAAARWLLVGALILLFGAPAGFLAVTTAFVLVLATFVLPPAALFRDRSFFGVTEVLRNDEAVILMHGTTIHGAEWLDPARRDQPGGYYARSGPVGDVFAVLHLRIDDPDIGVLGLGAGTLAAYADAGDTVHFFEIDDVVARVAADTRLFHYLADTQATVDVRIGDGRLLLAKEPDASYDLVMMDAFSSDSIPVHLITVEAMADAMRAVRGDGLLAVHVSNRYYDLAPAVAAAAHRLGLAVLERQYTPSSSEREKGAGPSHWVIIARDDELLDPFGPLGWTAARVGSDALTDDFADLLRHLRPGAW